MGRKKPGPKAQRSNPFPLPDEEVDGWDGNRIVSVRAPLAEWTAWITADEIDKAERALRRSFKARKGELDRRPTETLAGATQRIALLVRDVAEENAAEHLRWTGRRQEDIERNHTDRLYPITRNPDGSWTVRYVGPDPQDGSNGPKHGSEWRYRIAYRPQETYDEATRSWGPTAAARGIERYTPELQSWEWWFSLPDGDDHAEGWLAWVRPVSWTLKTTWPNLVRDLQPHVARMLRGEMGWAGKEGAPPSVPMMVRHRPPPKLL